eukprot:scaffold44820_cov267-Amphora_coffeaeformis.AAC.1
MVLLEKKHTSSKFTIPFLYIPYNTIQLQKQQQQQQQQQQATTTTTFTMDTASITTLFQSGRIRHMTWDACAIKYARLCLPSIVDMESLTLINNEFCVVSNNSSSTSSTSSSSKNTTTTTTTTTTSTLTILLKLLPPSLQTLRIEQDDLGVLLPHLAATAGHWKRRCGGRLQHLELIMLTGGEDAIISCEISPTAAKYLSTIVQIPQHTLCLTFTTAQSQYQPILQALRQGLDDLQRTDPSSPPQIIFRKVTFPNHETLLTEFALPASEANVITALQLHPYRHLTTHRYTDCRVNVTFFRAIQVLLESSTRLTDLEITHVEASPELRQQQQQEDSVHQAIWQDVRDALCANTTLQRLALRSTRGLNDLWIKAIFPALATHNRTLRQLEFAHVHATAVTTAFLYHLPHMHGLRVVHAPAGRQTLGRLWWKTLRDESSMPPMDLTVEFTSGTFSAKVGEYHDGAIEALLRRNRLYVRAVALLGNKEGKPNQSTGTKSQSPLPPQQPPQQQQPQSSNTNTEIDYNRNHYNNNMDDDEIKYLHALVDFGQDVQGLSAVYAIVRGGCLSWF